MIYLTLTQGYEAIIDDCDAELALKKWTLFHVKKTRFYAYRRERLSKGVHKSVLLHRVIARRMDLPIEGLLVDHENGDGLDCQRHNIKVTDFTGNARNKNLGTRNTGDMIGVDFNKIQGQWRARLGQRHLGWFSTMEEAKAARLGAERLEWGIHPTRAHLHKKIG